MSDPDGYYGILGARPSATHEQLKRAYRAAVKTHHPDRGGSADTTRRLNQAWSVLGDPTKRAQYDNRATGESGRVHTSRPHTARPNLRVVFHTRLPLTREWKDFFKLLNMSWPLNPVSTMEQNEYRRVLASVGAVRARAEVRLAAIDHWKTRPTPQHLLALAQGASVEHDVENDSESVSWMKWRRNSGV